MDTTTNHDDGRPGSPFASLLTRDGLLSELTIDRYLLDDLSEAEREAVDDHLADHPGDRARVDAVRAFDAEVALGPPPGRERPAPAAVLDLASARRRRTPPTTWAAGATGALIALAALWMLVIRPPVPAGEGSAGDGLRVKGGSLDLEVFVHDGTEPRPVDTGMVVHGGERFGFRVGIGEGGWLLIAGADDQGNAYICYPQDAGGQAARIEAADEPVALDQAMRFDAVLGHERLVAWLCPAPFTFDEVGAALAEGAKSTPSAERLPVLRAGCVQREVVLEKRDALAPRGAR